jgi:hypothetical protein
MKQWLTAIGDIAVFKSTVRNLFRYENTAFAQHRSQLQEYWLGPEIRTIDAACTLYTGGLFVGKERVATSLMAMILQGRAR